MKNIKKYILLFFINVLLMNSCVVSQSGIKLSTKNKKAKTNYIKATTYYDRLDYINTQNELNKAISTDPNFVEAYMLLGDVNTDLKNFEEAIEAYSNALTINPYFFVGTYFNLANVQLKTGLYEDAKSNYELYLKYGDILPARKSEVERKIAICEFAIEAIANPVPFTPINMGDSINTPNDEYLPALTADEQTLIITMRRPKDEFTINQKNTLEEDFYFSKKINGQWSKIKFLGPPINTHGNEGAQCISPDGKFLIFTGCYRNDGLGSCDLYISEREGNKWGFPVNMGTNINTLSWESQPSIAPDGKTLFYTSTRTGGKGSSDIWVSVKNDDGEWGKAFNLGEPINTPGQEMSPFIHPDGRTLYFSSDYHIGMGGMDLFVSRLNEDGKWEFPENLGYPINTYEDEVSLLVNANGDLAYFSSNKHEGLGNFDIFTFEMPQHIRPNKVNYFKGIVYDSETHENLKAKFQLIDLETNNVVVESYSDKISGEFLVCIPTNKNYALNVSKESYLFYSENFTITGLHQHTEPFLKDIPLKPIKKNQSIVLKNIFFDTDKYDLKAESSVELNKLLDLMKENPAIKVEISGHTDNVGTDEHNLKLSENRAKAVYDYLSSKGIAQNRMVYKGYGKSKPIDTNNTEEGRANNRRTEFMIVDF
jgi:outer membrane protein OmpA-like peptidoglycan-associated protein